MLVIRTERPKASIKSIKRKIDEGKIDTWTYKELSSDVTRLDWTGGQDNWPNLDKRVYFTVRANSDLLEDRHMLFKLHTAKRHVLLKSDYARMHGELSYMLFSHITSNIIWCMTNPADIEEYNADIVDEPNK